MTQYERTGGWRDIAITARYEGPEQRLGDRCISVGGGTFGPHEKIQAAVEMVFADLEQRTGFKFHKPRARFESDESNECSAHAFVGNPEQLMSPHYDKTLEVILYKK